MSSTKFSRWILGPGLMALALASGCSDDAPATDAGVTDAGVTDAGATDAGGDGGTAGPVAVAISAAGHDRLYGVTYDSTGRIYAVGQAADSTESTADFRTVVVRFTAAGERDATFGEMGVASHNIATGTNGENARGLAVQSTGKVVALATVEHPGAADARDRDIALVRFNANGTLDRTFGTMGVVTLDLSEGAVNGTGYLADGAWGLAVYSDDRLLVTGAQVRAGGMDTDFAVLRLNADGSRDTAFGTNGLTTVDINNRNASPRTSTILPDGSTVTAGYMDDGGVVKPVLFKLTPAGQLDTTFAQGGIFAPQVLAAATEAYGAALQGTSFVTAGYGRNAATESLDWLSLRITAAGQLDTTYGTMGVARIDLANFNDNARAVLVLPNDRVMLVGGGRPAEMNVDGMIAVLTPDGQPDTSFGARGYRTYDFGGASDFFWSAALSPSRDRVALVGVRGVGSNPGNDDAMIYVMPTP